jgi:hypothetical protein
MEGKKIGQVLIRGFKYDLLDIPGKEHNKNGYKSTTWIKKEKDLFTDETEYIPWLDKGTNKDCWGVVIKQGNSMKFKYNEWDIQGHTSVIITYNNEDIYEFTTDNLEYAFNESQNKIYKLKQLPLNFDNGKSDVGRKVYYKGLPAKIATRFVDGSLILHPDCKDEDLVNWWNSLIEPWSEDYTFEYLEECKGLGEIKVDMLSEYIYWYRNDRKSKLNKIKRKTKKGTQ